MLDPLSFMSPVLVFTSYPIAPSTISQDILATLSVTVALMFEGASGAVNCERF